MRHNYHAILETLNTAVLQADAELKISYANTAAQQLLGMSLSRLTTLKATDLIDRGEHTLLSTLNTVAQEENFQGITFADVILCPEPSRNLTADLNVEMYSGGEKFIVIEIRSNLHQQKLMDEVNQRSQHNAARDLIRSLAHEIKNPLGGIRGAAQLLEISYGKTEGLKDYTSLIIEQTDRLKALVDRLLGPQRPNPLTLCNIHFVIEKVLSLVSMDIKGKVRIVKDYDPSLPELSLDLDGMQQVLINIILNAAQALAEAKTTDPFVKIVTRAVTGTVIHDTRFATCVCISISNNGPEIPENIRSTIFFPMVTTKPTGNGLGLSIAQNIIQRHNGQLECASSPELTTFRILLPLRTPKNRGE